jgi:hypothetical protein
VHRNLLNDPADLSVLRPPAAAQARTLATVAARLGEHADDPNVIYAASRGERPDKAPAKRQSPSGWQAAELRRVPNGVEEATAGLNPVAGPDPPFALAIPATCGEDNSGDRKARQERQDGQSSPHGQGP